MNDFSVEHKHERLKPIPTHVWSVNFERTITQLSKQFVVGSAIRYSNSISISFDP